MQGIELAGGQIRPLAILVIAQVVVRLAQKASGAAGSIIDGFAQGRPGDLDHGADQRTWCVVLAAVAPGVAHVFDLGLIEMRKFVLLLL